MATTTNYGWTTPDDTALVKDGAAAIRTLGTSADTTVKNLNPETTLGDLAYRSSSSNVKTRLGIGSTGQILTVASGVPSWATPSASGARGLNQIVPTSVAVGSGSSSVGANGLVTFTTVGTNLSINGCFTSTYTNYQIVIDADHSESYNFMGVRMRVSGTDNTTANSYVWQSLRVSDSTLSGTRITGAVWTDAMGLAGAGTNGVQMSFFRPFEADTTGISIFGQNFALSGAYVWNGNGYHTQNTSYDGFSITIPAGTITGRLRVYGWQE